MNDIRYVLLQVIGFFRRTLHPRFLLCGPDQHFPGRLLQILRVFPPRGHGNYALYYVSIRQKTRPGTKISAKK